MAGSLPVGLVIGLVVGAGGMYLALRPPWAKDDTAPIESEQVAEAPTGDAGVGKAKKKRKGGGRRPSGAGGQNFAGGEDEDWANQGGTEETAPPQLVQLSAGDRTMEWRGDDTSPGKQTLDMGNGAEARTLDNSEISSVVASQSGGVQNCFMKAAANTDLFVESTIKMVVEGNGKPARSRVHAPRYFFSQGVLGCVQSAVRGMKFPATGMATLVTFPVNLTRR